MSLKRFRIGKLNRFRDNKGAITLEALLSLVLLFVCMYVVWGVALVIYNQSKLNTATQLSAQAGLITLNRTNYTAESSSQVYASEATLAAKMVFQENMCGTMAGLSAKAPGDAACNSTVFDPIARTSSGQPMFELSLGCGTSVVAAINNANCLNPNNRAVRFRVIGRINSPFPFAGGGEWNASSTTRGKTLNSSSSVYSYTR